MSPRSQVNVIVTGISGSGKTAILALIERALHAEGFRPGMEDDLRAEVQSMVTRHPDILNDLRHVLDIKLIEQPTLRESSGNQHLQHVYR
jgi:adenylate kinase